MFITTHETAKESPKEVPAPGGIYSDKDSTNNDQGNEGNQEVSIPINEDTGKNLMILSAPISHTTDYGHRMKPLKLKSRAFGFVQTYWTDKFWGIWGIFDQTSTSTHFGTMSPLSMFPIIQPLFLQKTKALYSNWSGSYLFCHLNSRGPHM